ncbi:MAG: ASPIC/UnbV domain-containing protein [Isosphaeraceae bacterium]
MTSSSPTSSASTRPFGGRARHRGTVLFEDRTREAGLALDTRPTTGWGIVLADFDQDGSLDLMAVNGHIRPEPGQTYPYENPPLLWRGLGNGRLRNVSATAGPYFQKLYLGRGLAAGDLDGDGDLDLVAVHHHAPSVVLWNQTEGKGKSLRVDLRGSGKNRDAVGARLVAHVGDRVMTRSVTGGGSYISSGDGRPHFGLGSAEEVDRLEIHWPDGLITVRDRVPAGEIPIRREDESSGTRPTR